MITITKPWCLETYSLQRWLPQSSVLRPPSWKTREELGTSCSFRRFPWFPKNSWIQLKLIQINHELKDEISFPLSEVLAYCARKGEKPGEFDRMLFSKSANCECAKPGHECSNFKILGSKFVSMEPSHTSSVTSWILSKIFVSTSSNTLEHNKTLINLASLRCFSILHRSRESQWILLRTKIRNNKTKNPLRQRVKRMCWMRVR